MMSKETIADQTTIDASRWLTAARPGWRHVCRSGSFGRSRRRMSYAMIDRMERQVFFLGGKVGLTNRNGCENLEVKVPFLHSVAHDTHAKEEVESQLNAVCRRATMPAVCTCAVCCKLSALVL